MYQKSVTGVKMFIHWLWRKHFLMHIKLLVYFNSIVRNHLTKAKLKEICLTFLLWPTTMEEKYIECWYRAWKCWVASFKETNLQHVSDFCYTFDPVYSPSTKMCYHNFSTFLMRPCGIELKYIECWYTVWKCLVASFKETNF